MNRTNERALLRPFRIEKVLDDFLQTFYSRQLNFLASDLLDKDYSPEDIVVALKKAMKICRKAGMDVDQHFMPLYTGRDGTSICDCKLSLVGYRLLLLNANPDNPATAAFQMKLLKLMDNNT